MKIALEYVHSIAAELSRQRRAAASESPAIFARMYLDHAFDRPACRLHTELNDQLERMIARRGTHLAVAAPRGHAKSTIVSLAYILWCLLYEKEAFILLVSATTEQADKLLDHVKRQLETNPRLREDFPELAGVKSVRPWRMSAILLPSGGMLTSCSAGQSIRGSRFGRHRPTLIVADDLEDKTQVVSEEQRGKLHDWFTSTLLKCGTPGTNVVVVGTVLHHDSLLANLLNTTQTPGWERLEYKAIEQHSDHPQLWRRWEEIYRGQTVHEDLGPMDGAEAFYRVNKVAMDQGARVLWPGQYSYRDLMEIRLREGEGPFEAEYQNQPLDPDLCIFSRSPVQFWNHQHASPQALVAALGGFGEFFGACDPGLGGNLAKGDYSAIIIIYKHWKSKVSYVVVADLARRTPDETITKIMQYCATFKLRAFSVESNNFQELMYDSLVGRLRAAGDMTPVYPKKNVHSKPQRIASLEPHVSQGLLVFNSTHELLMEQLRSFPLGKHDDGPDALQIAVADAEMLDYSPFDPSRPRGKIGSVGGREW